MGKLKRLFTPVLKMLFGAPWPLILLMLNSTSMTCGQVKREFDFVVVGGGVAGSVVANRLSEVARWNVLLLEAGRDDDLPLIKIPSLTPQLLHTSMDWGYYTQPQNTSCLSRKGGRCYWPRGKVLGGCSSINGMMYVRGSMRDYDEWAELGNDGWRYEDVFPYFLKSEDNGDEDIASNSMYHSTGGYQHVERFPYADANAQAILQSFEEMGYTERDINAESQIGYTRTQTTSKDGQRMSTSRSFLSPIRGRRNLRILTEAFAVKVLFTPLTRRAIGVRYVMNGKSFDVFARKEVIVCAGAINSPQLLILSGIGPERHLKDLNIPVLSDLQVGENLQEHVNFQGLVISLNQSSTMPRDALEMSEFYTEYFVNSTGPISATGTLQVIGFVRTPFDRYFPRRSRKQEGDVPDIQYVFEPATVNDPLVTPNFAFYNSINILVILLRPKSKGYIQLKSSDPFEKPLIFPNFFTEDEDVKTLSAGANIAVKLSRTQAVKAVGGWLNTTKLPDCKWFDYGSDEYWSCLMQNYTRTIFHPAGTCKMGPSRDRSAVVAPDLTVYGVKGLRVIDASIMPLIVRGNTMAPTMMIAEKGSDMIKERWG